MSRFRLIAATNRDLGEMVEEGSFRKDLLFRLRALEMELPALRERKEDIVELARYHLARLCDLYGVGSKGFCPDFQEALTCYDWPGNVRELVNVLDGAVALSGKNMTLFAKHLPVALRVNVLKQSLRKRENHDDQAQAHEQELEAKGALPSMRDFRESLEREYLSRLIADSLNDPQEATRISGMSKSRLYELMNKHKLSFSRSVSSDQNSPGPAIPDFRNASDASNASKA